MNTNPLFNPSSLTLDKGFIKSTRFIGEQYEGGIIFHLWEDTKGELHGLVVSLEKSEAFYPYSNLRNELIGSSAQSAWNGLANTLHIVQQNGHLRSCAEYCLQLNAQGYDDWYLPSIDEESLNGIAINGI